MEPWNYFLLDVTSCTLVERYKCFGRTSWRYHVHTIPPINIHLCLTHYISYSCHPSFVDLSSHNVHITEGPEISTVLVPKMFFGGDFETLYHVNSLSRSPGPTRLSSVNPASSHQDTVHSFLHVHVCLFSLFASEVVSAPHTRTGRVMMAWPVTYISCYMISMDRTPVTHNYIGKHQVTSRESISPHRKPRNAQIS